MAYKKLTEAGKNFIRNVCKGNGDSLLKGKNSKGPLPNCSPPISPDKIWESNAKFNNTPITTNSVLGEALISWYEKYANIFELDSNIMAAQAYAESGYKIWNYAPNSGAMGVSQFMAPTVYEIIIKNSYLKKNNRYSFTEDEINAITKGLENPKDPYSYLLNEIGKRNRAKLHQNVIDNPEIMIKAQFYYMKYLGTLCDNLASSALFAYNRGPKYCKKNYVDSVKSAVDGNGYEIEGINYVSEIFKLLGDCGYNRNGSFGYDKLHLNDPFDEHYLYS